MNVTSAISEFVFPCLDLARLAFLNSFWSNEVLSNDVDCINFLELIILFLKNGSLDVNQVTLLNHNILRAENTIFKKCFQMLALKVLSNIFSSTSGCSLMFKVRPIIFEQLRFKF